MPRGAPAHVLAGEDSPDILRDSAGVAQLAERLTCNQQVGGSSPLASSSGGEHTDASGTFDTSGKAQDRLLSARQLGRDYAQTAP